MGVRGLTTYINNNQDIFLKKFLLHDSYLVIDGHSLCAQLYRSLNCFSAFGGDYDKYSNKVKIFFKSMHKCHITPYVLFDGSYENRKLKTAYKRLKSKINGASQLDPVTQGSLKIFPILLRDVFIEVLKDMDVLYTTCEFEADDEIAVVARRLNCPVLSYDSDFFIYNVLYIPFNTLDYKPKPYDVDDKRIYAVECKIYKVEHITSHFGGLKRDMLPLLATLLGNDFIEKRVFSNFSSQLKLFKSKKAKNEQQIYIQSLLKWLQGETLDSAIVKILGRIKKPHKNKVLSTIQQSVKGYNNTNCNSFKYLNIMPHIMESSELNLININSTDIDFDNEDVESCEEDSDTDESTDVNDDNDNQIQRVPDWFSEGIRLNIIPKLYINLYTHHLHYCNPQAEDYTAEDSFLCTLSILRYAFDLLTDFSEEYCTYVSRVSDNNYKRIFIDNQYSIQRPLDIQFCDLTEEQLKLCFHHFIKETLPLLDLSIIDILPSNFRIFMLSILWWVSKCEVMLGHIHSLLVCYIMLEVIDEKTGTFRGHHFLNNKYSNKIDEIRKSRTSTTITHDDLLLNKNKVQYDDCLIAASVLLKHFELDDKIKKKPKTYDVKKIHVFAQFQCCLLQFNALNNLCRYPYESTKFYKSYNGTFVYNVASKLENEMDPVSFLERYLDGATTVLMMYRSLCEIYNRCAEKMKLVTKSWERKRHRRRKNAIRSSKLTDDIHFIVNGFEAEVVI